MPFYDMCLLYGFSAAVTFFTVIAPVLVINSVCRRRRASGIHGQCR